MSVHVGYTVTDNTVPNSHSGAPPLRLAQSYTPRKSLQINVRRSVVLYDADKDFVHAMDEVPDEDLLHRLYEATPVRYCSAKGI